MENLVKETTKQPILQDSILLKFTEAIETDTDWVESLLYAICEWTVSSETIEGTYHQYLILGEGLDWLALANRLCSQVKDAIPDNELNDLVMYGVFPQRFETDRFKELIGPIKYGFYLNYWYGVVVEEAIQNAIERDIRKRHLALCYQDSENLFDLVYERLYGETKEELLSKFGSETGVASTNDMTVTRMKEFTYWLHKIRINKWDPARVASDTKRGLLELEHYGIYSY